MISKSPFKINIPYNDIVMDMRIILMTALVAVMATAIVPVVAADQVPYFAGMSISDYERTSYAEYDLIMADVKFTGMGWGMPANGIWSIWDIDGSQIEEASYETVIKMINSTELDDLKSYYCPKDGRLSIAGDDTGIVKMCFVVPENFEPDVISFRAGVGWMIAPLREPSVACESYRDFCNKSGAYVISEKQPKSETIQVHNAAYNTQSNDLVIFWSEPVTFLSATNMLFADSGIVEISADDYRYDIADTVMWFKFNDEVAAQIGETDKLRMFVNNEIVGGYDDIEIGSFTVEVTIVN